jgi:hypothetical protein|tara:strand:- start:114 stop:236 length:123 start_codon:yes stop_codon:yes gene_type:complete
MSEKKIVKKVPSSDKRIKRLEESVSYLEVKLEKVLIRMGL